MNEMPASKTPFQYLINHTSVIAICGGVALAVFDSVACEHTLYMPEDEWLLAQLRAIHKFNSISGRGLDYVKCGIQLETIDVFEHQPAE